MHISDTTIYAHNLRKKGKKSSPFGKMDRPPNFPTLPFKIMNKPSYIMW